MNLTVRAVDVRKVFPTGVVANDSVSIEARPGEIHAVLGENGAGKTTLMRMLAGIYAPDSGAITLNDNRVVFRNPKDARAAGVGMVHQYPSLIPSMTVAENLALSGTRTGLLVRPSRLRDRLREAADRSGLAVRLDARVADLSMGERQRVELFRAFIGGARVLILDEPTSVLTPQDSDHLFAHLRRLTDNGHTILLVTHKIPHVRAVADRVTILRRGRVTASRVAADLSCQELAELMVGGAVDSRPVRASHRRPGQSVRLLDIDGLRVEPTLSPCGLSGVSFSLSAGEVVGVAGVSGSGQDELVAALTGEVGFDGQVRYADRVGRSRSGGRIAYIPADRPRVGAALGLSVRDNLVLRACDRRGATVGPVLRDGPMTEIARARIAAFGIQPADPATEAFRLSGGNLLKVVLARELSSLPAVIVAVNPTAGLDVGTVRQVHTALAGQAEAGAGVLLVSEDLDELLALCDRILVLFAGRLAGEVEPGPAARQQVARLMSGLPAKEAAAPTGEPLGCPS